MPSPHILNSGRVQVTLTERDSQTDYVPVVDAETQVESSAQ
eukprot:SAG31_NODE_33287_length_345_cov_1.268293_1_plen_40_part_10